MIIQALCRYYDILEGDEYVTLPGEGQSIADVSFAFILSTDGQLTNIMDLRSDGKKPRPRAMAVPFQKVRSSGIAPYLLCDNSKHVLGVEKKKGRASKKVPSEGIGSPVGERGEEFTREYTTPRSLKCFEEFRKLHHDTFGELDLDATRALLRFLDAWNPKKFYDHPKIRQYSDELLAGGNIVFEFDRKFIHEYDEVQELLANRSRLDDGSGNDVIIQQCLVSGKSSPISRVHPKIKGVTGAQSTGASLVSFNDEAFQSYGKEQNYNAPISESTALEYTYVLNHFLERESKNKMRLDNTTIVFWAETTKKQYLDLTAFLLDPPTPKKKGRKVDEAAAIADREAIQWIGDVLRKVKAGMPLQHNELGIDVGKTNFYMLGLSPNAGRLSVRFWYEDTVGRFIERLAQHHLDMEIIHDDFDSPYISIYRILKETVPRNSKNETSSPLLEGALMRAILGNAPYPLELYNAILSRIKIEGTINHTRAAFLKAYLIRSNRQKKNAREGWISVSLNEESTNVPYRLGRLFAVLEKAQRDAIANTKSGINSKYFSSASTTPSVVFPVLLKLAQHHISKSDWGFVTNKSIEEIMSGIDQFPRYLDLEDQGRFMLGYYHQRKELFRKKKDNEEEEKIA